MDARTIQCEDSWILWLLKIPKWLRHLQILRGRVWLKIFVRVFSIVDRGSSFLSFLPLLCCYYYYCFLVLYWWEVDIVQFVTFVSVCVYKYKYTIYVQLQGMIVCFNSEMCPRGDQDNWVRPSACLARLFGRFKVQVWKWRRQVQVGSKMVQYVGAVRARAKEGRIEWNRILLFEWRIMTEQIGISTLEWIMTDRWKDG